MHESTRTIHEESHVTKQSILIEGGMIVDGSGSHARQADVLVSDGCIKQVDLGIQASADEIIDADGLHVCPGFIDLHAHTGLKILSEPLSPGKILQGVTTDVVGNCGLGLAPASSEIMEYLNKMAKDLLGGRESEGFLQLSQFKDRIRETGMSQNLAFLVPHGNVRAMVMGLDPGKPTRDQLNRMRGIVDLAMTQGAFGMSTGLIYPPGSNSGTKELIELAKVVAAHGGFYATHLRSEGGSVVKALKEAINIGREASIPIQISHVKVGYFSRKTRGIIKTIEEARNSGLDVLADQYPYTAGCTSFGSVILPTWVFQGGMDAFQERLRDPKTRKRIIKDGTRNLLDMVNVPRALRWMIPRALFRLALRILSKGFLVTHVANHHDLEGTSLKEILMQRYATSRGMFNKLLDFLADENGVVTTCMFMIDDQKTLEPLMQAPWTCISSDAYRGHPRSWGTFPRVLARYVREKGILSLEEAIHKMTGLPASRLGLQDRGLIRPGYKADLVIFNASEVQDRATYDAWDASPVGISRVLVNGEITAIKGSHVETKAGMILEPPCSLQQNVEKHLRK
ncbi:amidohydrolase family protein [Candidatus Bathyarchaeota archaeon]|nr:amidohydrolase family protein [Candidatus Bathyarchaeota archaeon]